MCSNYKIERNTKLYFFFFFFSLADLKVPATEAARKIMSWREKKKSKWFKKKKV